MIVDVLDKKELYYNVHNNFKKAFEFIEKVCNENLDLGKYELDGKNLYAMVQEYDTKAEGNWECHRKYIDIQYIVSGEEIIGVAPIQNEKSMIDEKPEKDVAHYSCKTKEIVLNSGEFMVLYPSDLHLPGKAANEPCQVLKVVVKIKAE